MGLWYVSFGINCCDRRLSSIRRALTRHCCRLWRRGLGQFLHDLKHSVAVLFSDRSMLPRILGVVNVVGNWNQKRRYSLSPHLRVNLLRQAPLLLCLLYVISDQWDQLWWRNGGVMQNLYRRLSLSAERDYDTSVESYVLH